MPKGRVTINAEGCKGCTLCTTVCQPRLLQMNTTYLNGLGYHPAQLDDPAGLCTGCGLCAVICPDVCITVYKLRAPRVPAQKVAVPA